MLVFKLGLFLNGGGLIGAPLTGLLLSSKYSEGLSTENSSPKLTGVKCQREDGVYEEIEMIQGIEINEELKKSLTTELKNDKGKCLTFETNT